MAETQLIKGDGEFNAAGLWKFMNNSVKLNGCGFSYAAVAAVGIGGTGKSTLMNNLFGTKFRECASVLDIRNGTKGIWLGFGIEPFPIVMDMECCHDSDLTQNYAKQRLQFALSLPNIATVIVNVWFNETYKHRSLFKTMFEAKLRLINPRKTTLFIVIHDKNLETPLKVLDSGLREQIQKIWESITKPPAYMDSPFSEFFSVEITALSHYRFRREQYNDEVAQLRKQFVNSIPPRAVVPASGFPFFAEQIWKIIKEDNYSDRHALKAMISTVACEDIADEKFSQLTRDEDWLATHEAAKTGVVIGFGKNMTRILDIYLSEYNSETKYFDQSARKFRFTYLESKILKLLHGAYIDTLAHLRLTASESFATGLAKLLNKGEGFAASVRTCNNSSTSEFDRGCSDAAVEASYWDDARKVRQELVSDIEAHASRVKEEKLSELAKQFEKKLSTTILGRMEHVFEMANTWPYIRAFLKEESDLASSGFASAVSGFELDSKTVEDMVNKLKECGRKLVERKAREEAGKVLSYMNERFSLVFKHDDDFMVRLWTEDEDIGEIINKAECECLKLLSALAVIRLDEDDKEKDSVGNMLFSTLLMDGDDDNGVTGGDSLALDTWDKVSEEKTLIKPNECVNLWRQFKLQRAFIIKEASIIKEAYNMPRRNQQDLLPKWAIMAMRNIWCMPI